MTRRRPLSIRRILILAAIAVTGLLAQRMGIDLSSLGGPSATGRDEATQRIERAFASQESGFMVTLDARVAKMLRDDDDGSRHQRFLIELPSGRTLLVAHNIDLAPRIPLDRGDRVRLRGQYEWNERGGVLHWTHRDPAGRRAGGWIEYQDERYE